MPQAAHLSGDIQAIGHDAASAVSRADEVLPLDVRDRWRSGLAHDRQELAIQDVEDCLHAGLAEGGKTPGIRSADANSTRAERECLEHIGAATDSTVNEYGGTSTHRCNDFLQAIDGCAQW